MVDIPQHKGIVYQQPSLYYIWNTESDLDQVNRDLSAIADKGFNSVGMVVSMGDIISNWDPLAPSTSSLNTTGMHWVSSFVDYANTYDLSVIINWRGMGSICHQPSGGEDFPGDDDHAIFISSQGKPSNPVGGYCDTSPKPDGGCDDQLAGIHHIEKIARGWDCMWNPDTIQCIQSYNIELGRLLKDKPNILYYKFSHESLDPNVPWAMDQATIASSFAKWCYDDPDNLLGSTDSTDLANWYTRWGPDQAYNSGIGSWEDIASVSSWDIFSSVATTSALDGNAEAATCRHGFLHKSDHTNYYPVYKNFYKNLVHNGWEIGTNYDALSGIQQSTTRLGDYRRFHFGVLLADKPEYNNDFYGLSFSSMVSAIRVHDTDANIALKILKPKLLLFWGLTNAEIARYTSNSVTDIIAMGYYPQWKADEFVHSNGNTFPEEVNDIITLSGLATWVEHADGYRPIALWETGFRASSTENMPITTNLREVNYNLQRAWAETIDHEVSANTSHPIKGYNLWEFTDQYIDKSATLNMGNTFGLVTVDGKAKDVFNIFNGTIEVSAMADTDGSNGEFSSVQADPDIVYITSGQTIKFINPSSTIRYISVSDSGGSAIVADASCLPAAAGDIDPFDPSAVYTHTFNSPRGIYTMSATE
tara:strand:+ start:2128 stop:4065 length:1938 start_codon:yes stop_codon:yes gene_type:complete